MHRTSDRNATKDRVAAGLRWHDTACAILRFAVAGLWLTCSTGRLCGQAGVLDPSFAPTLEFTGGSPVVRAITRATNNRLLIGGTFTSVNGSPINCVALLLPNGALDTSFFVNPVTFQPNSAIRTLAVDTNGWFILSGLFGGPGPGLRFLCRVSPSGFDDTGFPEPSTRPDGSVDAIVVAPDNAVWIGGSFSAPRNRIARYNSSGIVDSGFNPGTAFANPVRALALQTDGKLLTGSLNLLARLNSNGTFDPAFNAGTGPDGEVLVIALQSDAKILVGGEFTAFNDLPIPYLVRLLPSGAIDSTFSTGAGPDNWVRCIVPQPDGRILIAGAFTSVDGVPRARIARLTDTGALDRTFSGDAATDDVVAAMTRQSNGLLALGGAFTTLNGASRNGLGRIGSTDMRIEAVQIQSNGVARVTTRGQPGLAFVLEATGDFANWSSITSRVSTIAASSIQDPESTNYALRFYRMRSP